MPTKDDCFSILTNFINLELQNAKLIEIEPFCQNK